LFEYVTKEKANYLTKQVASARKVEASKYYDRRDDHSLRHSNRRALEKC